MTLKGIKLVSLLEELNGLDSWVAFVGNAYLEAKTKEKTCVIAELEFIPLKDHFSIVTKSLHGLHASGLFCYERLADYLRSM